MTKPCALARTTPLAAFLMLGVAHAAFAQGAAAGGADTVSEVVVTAQKRTERLQDVPVAVSALSSAQLSNQHVAKVDDITSFVPALQATSPDGEGTPIFALRGVSMSDYSLSQDGPVATYFDETYANAFALLGIRMFDLQRVEVLRGPQGTLYGRNTTGGAVNIISNKPTFTPSGDISVGYGNYNHWQASGDVNGPLWGDKVAGRFAFTAEKADGWMTDALPGKPKLDGLDGYAGRLSLLARPTSNSEFILRIAGSWQNPVNFGVKGVPLDSTGIGGPVYNLFGMPGYAPPAGLGPDTVQNAEASPRLAQTWSASLHGDIQLPHRLAVTSITAWDWGKLFFPDATDGAPNQALQINYFARARQFAQDLRLTSNFTGPFDFILGAYFNREEIYNATVNTLYADIDVNGDGVIDAQDCLAGFPVACKVGNSFTQIKTSTAVYTDMKYRVSDHITLRGGLRYTRDDGRLEGFQSQFGGVDGTFLGYLIQPGDVAAEGANRFKRGNVSGKAGVDYKTSSGQLFYLSFSRGYRGDAFNAQGFFSPAEVTVAKPETLSDVEGGAKLQLFERRMTLNLSAYHYDYRNMQFINVTPNLLQQLVNLPRATVDGGEVELTARPTHALSLHLGLGVLSSEIQEGQLLGQDLKGHQLANAPKVSTTIGADWTIADLSAGTLALHGDSVITSKQYFDVFNGEAQAQKAYGLVNGNLGFRSSDHRWGVSLWAKNVFDQHYYSSIIKVQSFNLNYMHVGTPRMFGANLDYSF